MRYFKPSEFTCKCGKCGQGFEKMDSKLITMLDELRDRVGIPLVLSSAYRCEAHNLAVGGVKNSAHARGKAVDIKCLDSHTRFKLLKAAFDVGFRRIEPRETWLHVDVDETKPQDVVFFK